MAGIGGLGEQYAPSSMAGLGNQAGTQKTGGGSTLNFDDFLYLMVQQFQNQTMDNTADTSDMMNQLVQMSVVQAVTNITDATTMMYAGSLVGKEVTVAGKMNADGKFEEIVGTVTATGTYGGEQVIFVNDKAYKLSEIMAIGKLPEIKPEPPKDPPEVDNTLPGEGDGEGEDGGDTGETPEV